MRRETRHQPGTAFARRTKKRLLSAAGEVLRETRYVWDGDVIVHELGGDEDELITWRFEPETFTPIAKEQGARRWAIASDHLGTPTEMVDELGKLAWKMQLDVLGVPAFEEGDAAHCPFRWPGQYEDEETGLYYNRFRYYDPEQGGYTADDPIGLDGGIRLRGYVEDPWTWVDPWGLIGCKGTPSERAASWQGKGDYLGVDDWHDVVLKKGTTIFGGAPGQSAFYTTARGMEQGSVSRTAMGQGLQVAPHGVLGYRPGMTAYEVIADTPAAFSIARANPRFGGGGLPQLFVPEYESVLRALYSIPLPT